MAKTAIIGSGFSGLSAASYLAAKGHEVHVFEKNATAGGRARQLKTDKGFVFDMGPSWYWMPEVYENFFADFGHSSSDFYELKLLNPSFEMVFGSGDSDCIPSDYNELLDWFESIESGSAAQLKRFMQTAEYKYKTGMGSLVHKPGLSWTEFADFNLLKGMLQMQVFSSFSKHIRRYFRHPKLLALMEFPVLFLGAMPQQTPALYSLMNYAGLKLGTWYPMGGYGSVIRAFSSIAREQGVHFHFNAPVEKLNSRNGKIHSVSVNQSEYEFDSVIASADYQHVENKLLEKEKSNYPEDYWKKKTFAPSCLIYYIGINKKLPRLEHHTLFFDEELLTHSRDIYVNPQWPSKPLFYVCCPSKTDPGVAPEGHENLFLLMPIAPGLKDPEDTREHYFRLMLQRLEEHAGTTIGTNIVYQKSYCVSDFIADYNSYKGNAYGLANTLMQTAIFKPRINNRNLTNLFYSGQLTVPGPGVPPAIISGKIAANLVQLQTNP